MDGGAQLHLAAHRLVGRLPQHHVIDRVRSDGRERVGGDLGDLLPGHAEVVADSGAIDAVARAEIAHRLAQIVLAVEAAQPPIDVLEELVFFFRGVAVVAAILAVHHQRDAG